MFNSSSEKPHLRQALAGDLKQGWDSTERLTNRLESYAILKQRTEKFYDWAIANNVSSEGIKYRKVIRELNKCGQYLIFRNYLVSLRTRLIGSCSCKQHLLCAYCASRRGVKYSVTYKEKFDCLQQELNQASLIFITFTVKNGEDLSERFRHLKTSIQKLTRWRSDFLKQKVITPTEMARIEGGVFSYEFKRGANSNEWHPHIHMLAITNHNSRIDVEKLKQEWQQVTGDSFVVNIRQADDNAFLEVFAYALKFSEMSDPDRWHAFKILKGERLISSYGALRGIELPESENDDLLDSDEPFVDVLYKWYNERGYQFIKEL